eukprot:scaffold4038_cov403-Prasinococcus_capsulatus_cf.AAC.2
MSCAGVSPPLRSPTFLPLMYAYAQMGSTHMAVTIHMYADAPKSRAEPVELSGDQVPLYEADQSDQNRTGRVSRFESTDKLWLVLHHKRDGDNPMEGTDAPPDKTSQQ